MTDVVVFTYVKGLAVGVVVGIFLGYTFWRLPAHWAVVSSWWQRYQEQRPKVVAEIARIEGAFVKDRYVPIQAPLPTLRERVADWFEEFERSTRPRTPEQVAQWAYEAAIDLR